QEGLLGPVRWGRRAAFFRDGRVALVTLGGPAPLQLHDLETRKVTPFGTAASWWGGAVSAGRKQVLPGGDRHVFWWAVQAGAGAGEVFGWDVEGGKELGRLRGHPKHALCVAFLPDGRRALTGGIDGTVRLWDLPAGKELQKFEGLVGVVRALDVSPDGKQALI